MTTERVEIEFSTSGIPETKAKIDSLQQDTENKVQTTVDLLDAVQIGMSALKGAASGLYAALIGSNEALNAELLKSQTNIASNLRLFREGTEIVNITDKITASQELLRESLKQIEIDTKDLVGVTTQQVNGVFQVLLQNSAQFIGQSKEFSDPIEAATASTKNWAAALGTLGLPLEQANQEIGSILRGDVNNPDSIIAKTLQISREQYDQWKANGELIDRLNEKLEVFAAGNALAANSVAGITSNIQSLVEDAATRLGEPLLEPVVQGLRDVYSLMEENLGLFEELAEVNIQQVIDIIDTIRDTVAKLAEDFNFNPEGFIEEGSEIFTGLLTLIDELIKLGGSFISLFGEQFQTGLANTVEIVKFAIEGLTSLATILNDMTGAVAGFLSMIPNLDFKLDFKGAQLQVAELTGALDDSIEAVNSYNNITDVLIAQSNKMANSTGASKEAIEGQIEQLEQQKKELQELKTFRDQDEESVKRQIDAIEEAIGALEGMGSASSDLEFQTKTLEDLGSAYEVMAGKAQAALTAIENEGNGNTEMFSEAVESLTELTEKQVKYGQISVDVARERMEAVANNTKVELDLRTAALETLTAIEQEFLDFKLSQIDSIKAKNEELAYTGEISQQENLERSLDLEQTVTDDRLSLIDKQIERYQELGLSTERLEQERIEIIQKAADTERAIREDIYSNAKDIADSAYDEALRATSKYEADRLAQITQARVNQVTNEEQYQEQLTDLTKTRLEAELQAEQENIARLAELAEQAPGAEAQIEAQRAIDDAKAKSAQIEQELLELQLDKVKKGEQAELDSINKRAEKVSEKYQEEEDSLKSLELSQEEYNSRVAQLNVERIKEQLEAELAAQAEIKSGEALDASKAKSKELTLELIDAEIAAEEAVQAELQAQVDLLEEKIDRKREYADIDQLKSELELSKAVEKGVLSKEEAEIKKLKITRDRVNKELKILQELAEAGTLTDEDDRLANEQQVLQAKIQISEINRNIADSEQAIIEQQEERKQEQADLKEEQQALNDIYSTGVTSHLQGESEKLEATRVRLQQELLLAQQRGDVEDAAQIEIELAQVINQEKEVQLEKQRKIVEEGYNKAISASEDELNLIRQKSELLDFQAQSLDREAGLRQSIFSVAQAQVSALDAGISNEISMVNEALGARTRLAQIEKLSGEEREKVALEEKALKAQLNALGEAGSKSEKELLEQRQVLQLEQLEAKRQEIQISDQLAQLELASQAEANKLAVLKADIKANELDIEADILDTKAAQLRAEAALTKDAEARAQLLEAADNTAQSAEATRETANLQREANQEQMEAQDVLLANQEKIREINKQTALEQLDTQEKILKSQQAYEATMKGLEIDVDTSSLREVEKEAKKIKKELNDALDVSNIPVNAEIPVNVSPANLTVKVDNNKIQDSMVSLGGSLDKVQGVTHQLGRTLSTNNSKLEGLSRALSKVNIGSGGGTTGGTFSANVSNNIVVNVPPGAPKPEVSVETLQDERAKTCQ